MSDPSTMTPAPYPDRIKCSSCGKPCSTEVPIGTKIRGYVQCETCMRDFIAASDAALTAELAQVADVIGMDSKGPVTRAPGKPMKHVVGPHCDGNTHIHWASDLSVSFSLYEEVLFGPTPQTSVKMSVAGVVVDLRDGTQTIDFVPVFEPYEFESQDSP